MCPDKYDVDGIVLPIIGEVQIKKMLATSKKNTLGMHLIKDADNI